MQNINLDTNKKVKLRKRTTNSRQTIKSSVRELKIDIAISRDIKKRHLKNKGLFVSSSRTAQLAKKLCKSISKVLRRQRMFGVGKQTNECSCFRNQPSDIGKQTNECSCFRNQPSDIRKQKNECLCFRNQPSDIRKQTNECSCFRNQPSNLRKQTNECSCFRNQPSSIRKQTNKCSCVRNQPSDIRRTTAF